MSYKYIDGGTVTSPRGFAAGATLANVGNSGEKAFDIAILRSDEPCTTAGVFTTNAIKAAPVLVCEERVARGRAQAVVANSGYANTCTGQQGLADAQQMATLAARKVGVEPEDVLVASTGVIGPCLPMDRIGQGIERIALSPQGGHYFARAIMTTDTVPKEVAVSLDIDGKKEVKIGGVAKGAGMIHPDMATMLCFLTTDAQVDGEFLQMSLKRAVDRSFNMITVDGDTSPNDMVMVMANGLVGNATLVGDSPHAEHFQAALDAVCMHLAKCIGRDGEGARKLIEVVVEGAVSVADAKKAARAVAGSSLVKTAVYGSDPNWGRVVAAVGRSGVDVVESRIDLYLDSLCLVKGGCAASFDVQYARELMSREEVHFRVFLNLGEGKATAWGCDLTEGYIASNAEYTT